MEEKNTDKVSYGLDPKMSIDDKLLDNLGKIAYTLDKSYLSALSENYAPTPFEDKIDDLFECNIRALRVNRLVIDKEEKAGECFKNVLNTFADGDHTLAMVLIHRPAGAELYFVVKNYIDGENNRIKTDLNLLDKSLKGNFPGTETTTYDDDKNVPENKSSEKTENSQDNLREYIRYQKGLFDFNKTISAKSISVLTNLPSEFSEDHITQGLEKLLNGIVPTDENDSYAIVFLAESLPTEDIRTIIGSYEDLATTIHPYANYQYQIGNNKTETQGEMESVTDTDGISNTITKTHSVNVGVSRGKHKGSNIGVNAGPLNLGINSGRSKGRSFGYGYSWSKSKTVSKSTSSTKGTSSSLSIGDTENTSYSYKSYLVSDLTERLSKTIERLNKCSGCGLWKFATYVFAKDAASSKNIASYVRALTQGKESYFETPVIQEWSYSEKDDGIFEDIKNYVHTFSHPPFFTSDGKYNGMEVTPTTYVGTDELAYVMSFPRKSVVGLPVIECASFGRDVIDIGKKNLERDIELGKLYHMHKAENKSLSVSKNKLTSHTFVTGSTGSGKSNAIYHLLSELKKKKIKFLVVEPAKGEYRDIFGIGEEPAIVYGTNPKNDNVLTINPFRFPEKTHICEHLDRLVEIFNACWPMYAAMPAILKAAIENSYKALGWDLINSENSTGYRLFPTFESVAKEIRKYLDSSEYSDENKGNYKGSLLTRLESLTNGINGMVFGSNDLADGELFEKNVIVDLSHVGSTETKSLIMGILVMKLQEYNSSNGEKNAQLKHVTVLEEAHNLLKKTSTDQTADGSNLLGKAVEMLTNSIAEMRTYGEGFIIADQAPGLLDPAVIRNTNTKIIMRLPDFSDRELVGNSANLNKEQIEELARLPLGVAAVYQNDWVQPVLCEFEEYSPCSEGQKYKKTTEESDQKNNELNVLDFFMKSDIHRKIDSSDDLDEIKEKINKSGLPDLIRFRLIDYLCKKDLKEKAVALAQVAYEYFNSESLLTSIESALTIEDWYDNLLNRIQPSVREVMNETEINTLIALLLHEHIECHQEYMPIYLNFMERVQKKINGGNTLV